MPALQVAPSPSHTRHGLDKRPSTPLRSAIKKAVAFLKKSSAKNFCPEVSGVGKVTGIKAWMAAFAAMTG